MAAVSDGDAVTTRKVTVLEENILSLAVEWAEKRETWEAECRSVSYGGALAPTAMALDYEATETMWKVLALAKRLRKQRAKAKR